MFGATALLAVAGATLSSVETAPARTADRSSAAAPAAMSLVGTWSRSTTCRELAAAFGSAGLERFVAEAVVGNGFVPGVTSTDQLRDPANPCLGAVPRRHAHFFRRNGEFGSLDWNGDVVDDGRYRVGPRGSVTIFKEFPRVTFRYRIRGNRVAFTPVIPRGCTAFRCQWAISVAYPGKTWARVR